MDGIDRGSNSKLDVIEEFDTFESVFFDFFFDLADFDADVLPFGFNGDPLLPALHQFVHQFAYFGVDFLNRSIQS